MSLFHVNRYIGDEDDIIEEDSRGTSAVEILQKIQKEADARRKSLLKEKKVKSKKIKERGKEERQIEEDDSKAVDCLQERLLKEKNAEANLIEKKKKRKSDLHEKKALLKDESSEEEISTKKKRKASLSESPPQNKKKKANQKSIENDESSDIDNVDDREDFQSPDNDKLSENETEMDSKEAVEKVSNTESSALNEIGGFTVIGEVKEKGNKQVKRVLPDWLADPSVISADLKTKTIPVTDITELDKDLKDSLSKNGITQFFPVQIQVIPMMLQCTRMSFLYGNGGYRPNDICVSAPTGSGKTLAFVLPIIHALKNRVTCHVRALAVLPVKDLGLQVYKVFKTYCEGTQLNVVSLLGQKSFMQEKACLIRKRSWGLENLADIIVATPGRLVDHIKGTPGFSLSQLRFLVIDEADRMMENITNDWLTQVENAVYSEERPHPGPLTAARTRQLQIPLQKLLFSATLSQNPDKLQQLNLFQPKLFTSVLKGDNLLKPIDVVTSPEKEASEEQELDQPENTGEFIGKYTTPAGLKEYCVNCLAEEKPLIVLHFLHHLKFRNILCFTNSKESTHRLHKVIELIGGITVYEFSSYLSSSKRTSIIKNFNKGKIDILICSDAMARGMDIENVKYVISYDPPPYIKTYIHRVGRTARAGKTGTAITLLQTKEFFHFNKMTKEAGKDTIEQLNVSEEDLEPIVPAFREALGELQTVLQIEKNRKSTRKH